MTGDRAAATTKKDHHDHHSLQCRFAPPLISVLLLEIPWVFIRFAHLGILLGNRRRDSSKLGAHTRLGTSEFACGGGGGRVLQIVVESEEEFSSFSKPKSRWCLALAAQIILIFAIRLPKGGSSVRARARASTAHERVHLREFFCLRQFLTLFFVAAAASASLNSNVCHA